jgi:hypothetical protein
VVELWTAEQLKVLLKQYPAEDVHSSCQIGPHQLFTLPKNNMLASKA